MYYLSPLAFYLLLIVIAQVEYKIITSVESIVPNGLGRSRIIMQHRRTRL